MQPIARRTRQRGFSMIELMVAMVVTLVVSGAIFGLLSAGGNAFRREPEVADRQQNIRIAMDMIARDIAERGLRHAARVAGVHAHRHAARSGRTRPASAPRT